MRKFWLAFTAVVVLSFLVLGWMGVRIYQAGAADSARGRHHGRRGGHSGGRDRGRPERLAVDGRHGAGFDLGARQLRRARLDRRLAAPRGGVHPRRVGGGGRAGDVRPVCRPSSRRRCRRGCSRRCEPTRYDPSSGVLRIDPARGKAFAANAAHYADVFTRGRPEYAIPRARSPTRSSCGSCRRSSSGRRGRPRPTGPTTRSPTPATGRTSRSSATRRRARRSCGPASASSCCSRASAPWSGTTRRGARSRRRAPCPRATRCSATRRRRRSARP